MRKLFFLLLVIMPAFAFSQQPIKDTANISGAQIRMWCGKRTTPLATPMLIVNGYEIDGKHLSKRNLSGIISIDVVRSEDYIKEYGEKAKNGVIKFTAKQEYFSELVKQGLIKPIL